MTQSSYSKQVFNENKPVLKEVPKDGNINELKKMKKTTIDIMLTLFPFMESNIY